MKTIVVFAVASLSELGGFGSIEMPKPIYRNR